MQGKSKKEKGLSATMQWNKAKQFVMPEREHCTPLLSGIQEKNLNSRWEHPGMSA
jgi:hypothetical protein